MLRYAKRGSGERLATGRLSRHGELIDLEGAVSVCSKNVGTRRLELLTSTVSNLEPQLDCEIPNEND